MSRDLPNLGLKGGYNIGEDDWGDDQNANLLKLSVLVQGGVTGIAPDVPATPTPGTVLILDETNATNPNAVAVFEGPVGEESWSYFEPAPGWLLWDNDQGKYLSFDGTTWSVLETGGGGGGGSTDYRVGFFFTTAPLSLEVLLLHVFTDAVTFADDFAGARGDAGTDPAATFVLDVRKNGASVGSISVSTSGVFTFSTTGSSVSFAAGDRMSIVGPSTVGSAADVCVTLKGEIS